MNQCAKELIGWYDCHRRPLPWRERIDVYHTWVCEVMSQQTILAVVVPKFSEFIKQLPTVDDLAVCDEDKLRQLWSGLGYYVRARNLKQGAQFIVEQLDGRFPQSYRDWLKIPGCGPYTAAVIASICYSERVACVDGNVVRVVSRLLALSQDVWSPSGQAAIRAYVTRMIPEERPGDFNQAMMELGATVCRKTQPHCHMCPLQQQCLAFARNCIDICPPKKPRRDLVDVELLALLFWREDDIFAIVERTKGFLSNTVGFPLISEIEAPEVQRTLKSLPELQVAELPGRFSHTITHHRIAGRVLVVAEVEKSISADIWQSLGFPQPLWVERDAIAAKLSTALDNKVFRMFQDHQEASQLCLIFDESVTNC